MKNLRTLAPAPTGQQQRPFPTTRQLLRGGKRGSTPGRLRAPWFAGFPARFRVDWTKRRK